MTPQTQEALKQAREALLYHTAQTRPIENTDNAIKAIDKALEQEPAQEPVAWMNDEGFGLYPTSDLAIPLYIHPHQWQGLTDEEVDDFMFQSCDAENGYSITDLIRLVEQALKEKNANNS
jgi:hypothetical protein